MIMFISSTHVRETANPLQPRHQAFVTRTKDSMKSSSEALGHAMKRSVASIDPATTRGSCRFGGQ
jgi:hypothetical protein